MEEQFESRVLTLKRWILPHSVSLMTMASGGSHYGDYLSFQDYHFVDITDAFYNVAEEKRVNLDRMLAHSYQIIRDKRDQQDATDKISIRQSLTLLGRRTTFWESKPKLVYTTMVQLKNSLNISPESVEREFKRVLGDQLFCNCAVYFTFDYCDVVLFTKDIGFELLHEKLWNMLLDGERLARYTTTVYMYENDYFLNCINGGREPGNASELVSSDKVLLSVDLTVPGRGRMEKLVAQLTQKSISLKKFQITGRFDLRLMVELPDSQSLIDFVKIMDEYGECCAGEDFISTVVTPLTEYDPFICKRDEKIAANRGVEIDDNNFVDAAKEKISDEKIDDILSKLYSRIENDRKIFGDGLIRQAQYTRICEAYRAVLALHRNGMASEFVLSVIASLLCFTKIQHAFSEKYANMDEDDLRVGYQNRLEKLQDDYLDYLETLIQCTMHGERQFIQAPSANLTFFDVPPKLIVFYTAIADRAARCLNDEDDRFFSFLIAPDFRDDIHVKPLAPEYPFLLQAEKQNSIHYINLDEKSFYEPAKAIQLLCHEVAHYVGSNARMRLKRAEFIFRTVGSCLILVLGRYEEIGDAITDVVADFLLKEYQEKRIQNQKSAEEMAYFTTEIDNFLVDSCAGINYFEDLEFVSDLSDGLIAKLSCLSSEEILTMIKKQGEFSQDAGWNDAYHQIYALNGQFESALLEILSAQILAELDEKLNEIRIMNPFQHELDYLMLFIQECILAFSEAYADYRMIELLDLTEEQYNEIVCDYKGNSSTSEIQKYLRYNAVKQARWPFSEERFPEPGDYANPGPKRMLQKACEYIKDYLLACADIKYSDAELQRWWKSISDDGAYNFIATIHGVILGYERRMAELGSQLFETTELKAN